ncbi:C39 family peptidase [Methanosarcina mazei]|uniref:C39 family peptidase n=1 Tax=Methanosarcina mazei TaxID=2209 RepID=UPI001F4382BA|nr:C39 family peptidase [Methanosarcina mazei]
MAEVMEKSIETAKAKYPTGKIVSTNMVVYDYPNVGAMTTVKDKTTGVEHRIFVDAYTLEEVQDKPATKTELGVWSMYEQVSKDKVDENLKDWQKSEQFTKKLEQEINDIGIDIGEPITEENIKKLGNKLNTSSKVIPSPYNSTVMPTTTDSSTKALLSDSTQVLLDVPLYGQEKNFYCVPATAKMIAAWHGYSYTQDYIYQKMGGTNGDVIGIGPTKAEEWYKLSRSEGGLGATRSYKTTTLSFTKAMSEIDYYRPFNSITSSHCRACAGYWVFYDSADDCLLINDPWNGGTDYWEAVSGSPEGMRIYVIF